MGQSIDRRRRRSADDSDISEGKDSRKFSDDLKTTNDLDELKQIIVDQRKLIQQLQIRIRLNTPEKTIEQLNEQIRVKPNGNLFFERKIFFFLQNLTRVIETYRNESNLIEREMKKLYVKIDQDQNSLEI